MFPSETSMAVQWFGLRALTAKGPGLIPGQVTKIPQATQCGQKPKAIKQTTKMFPPIGPIFEYDLWPLPYPQWSPLITALP